MNTSNEPVVIAAMVQAILVAIVSVGWMTIDSVTIDSIATIVGVFLTGILTLWTRSKVTPVAKNN